MSDGRAHLDARPFAAEREACANCQQAADEFDRQQNERSGRQLAVDDGLDVRNPAANGMLAETAHEPRAEGRSHRRARDQEATTKERLAVPHDGQGNSKTIDRSQRPPEKPAD